MNTLITAVNGDGLSSFGEVVPPEFSFGYVAPTDYPNRSNDRVDATGCGLRWLGLTPATG